MGDDTGDCGALYCSEIRAMIMSPAAAADHPDRIIDCETAAEDELRALANRIEAAGRTGDEAAAALPSLAQHYAEWRRVTAADERRILDALKKAQH